MVTQAWRCLHQVCDPGMSAAGGRVCLVLQVGSPVSFLTETDWVTMQVQDQHNWVLRCLEPLSRRNLQHLPQHSMLPAGVCAASPMHACVLCVCCCCYIGCAQVEPSPQCLVGHCSGVN
jgi:hypothetical protein